MASGLGVHVPRLAILVVAGVLATATITWGAAQQLTETPATVAAKTPVAARTLVVPPVVGQAYVFAKGTLEDGGFAWRVAGRVRGFAVNTVTAQSPPAGVRVRDTGAPTITLTLARSPRYPERGTPENFSPYRGTALVRTDVPAAKPKPKAAKPKPATPALAKRAEAAKPKAPAKPKVAAQKRPPAFAVAGAPKEPLKEMPLVNRARLLSAWLTAHPESTQANVDHFLYQHAWIVTGARFGWWRGADALRALIAADRKAESVWGIGARSRQTAREALAYVEARSR